MNKEILQSELVFPKLSRMGNNDGKSKEPLKDEIIPYKVFINSELESTFVNSSTKVSALLDQVKRKYDTKYPTAQIICEAYPSIDPNRTVSEWYYNASKGGDIRVLCSIEYTDLCNSVCDKVLRTLNTMNVLADLTSRFYQYFALNSQSKYYYESAMGRIVLTQNFYEELKDDVESLLKNGLTNKNGLIDEFEKNPASYPLLTKMFNFGRERNLSAALILKLVRAKRDRNSQTHINMESIYAHIQKYDFSNLLSKDDFPGNSDITYEDYKIFAAAFNPPSVKI